MYHLLHEEPQCSFFVFWSAAVNGTKLFLFFYFYFTYQDFFSWGCLAFSAEQWTGRNSLWGVWKTKKQTHGADPTQGTSPLLFINFSVAQLIFSMILAMQAHFFHTTELFSRWSAAGLSSNTPAWRWRGKMLFPRNKLKTPWQSVSKTLNLLTVWHRWASPSPN